MKLHSSSLLLTLLLAAPSLAFAEPVSSSARKAFAKAHKERVAVVGIGDSNQRFGGHGWSKYMALALSKDFGCWGSELAWMCADASEAESYGPVPPALAEIAFTGWFLPAGVKDRISWKHGQLHIAADHPLDIMGPLRFSMVYGTFAIGEGGSFRPSARLDQPPWKIFETHPPITTASKDYSLQEVALELPADSERSFPLLFSASPFMEDIHGPFFAQCMQVTNEAKKSGIAYSTLYAQGGKSLHHMQEYLREILGPKRLTEYFRCIRRPLNGDKRCIVMINSGLNDLNDKAPSTGPEAGHPSSSPEGYRDNLLGLVKLLENAWIAAGGDRGSIFFAFMPSHALEDSQDRRLVAYREQAVALAQELPNAGSILLPQLIPHSVMESNHYYDRGATSNPHLASEGYQAISEAVAHALAEKK